MATEARVCQLVQRLVDAGRIYYGQSTEALSEVLRSAAKHWVTKHPDSAPQPWGPGPNENLEFLVCTAQSLVYGVAISWEQIQSLERRQEGIFEYAATVHRQTRGGGSPYSVDMAALCEYLLARRREALPDMLDSEGRMSLDCRTLAERVGLYGQCLDGGLEGRAAWLMTHWLDWLGRRNHAMTEYAPELPPAKLPEVYAALASESPYLRKPLLLACQRAEWDVPNGRLWLSLMRHEKKPLDALEETIAAHRALCESAGLR
jgi:hypothetical protein